MHDPVPMQGNGWMLRVAVRVTFFALCKRCELWALHMARCQKGDMRVSGVSTMIT